MPTRIAAHFEALRHRFPAESSLQITNTQQSFEAMEFYAHTMPRPADSRSAYIEIGNAKLLIWEMDAESDCFQIFATTYNIPLGTLRLSSKPSGIIEVAGFRIDLGLLAEFITSYFKPISRTTTNPETKTPKIMLFGFAESFGHHFWNEVSGLASVIETGIFDSLDGVLVGPYDYFHLAPALEKMGKQVWKTNLVGAQLPAQLMIYSNSVVTEEARRLILNNALAQAPTSPTEDRTICFQIRRHRRPWINEEDGLVEIIKACEREWPGTRYIIDGHSTSQGAIAVKEKEIENEIACFYRICKKLGSFFDLHSTIGLDVNAKINILKHADLFVGPIGSGGVMSSWLLRKPTINYGPTSFYDLIRDQESSVPEGGSLTVTVPKENITDIDDQELSFDVSPNDIFSLIQKEFQKNV